MAKVGVHVWHGISNVLVYVETTLAPNICVKGTFGYRMDFFSLGSIMKLICRGKLCNGHDRENKILILPLQIQLTRVIVWVTQKIHPKARTLPLGFPHNPFSPVCLCRLVRYSSYSGCVSVSWKVS